MKVPESLEYVKRELPRLFNEYVESFDWENKKKWIKGGKLDFAYNFFKSIADNLVTDEERFAFWKFLVDEHEKAGKTFRQHRTPDGDFTPYGQYLRDYLKSRTITTHKVEWMPDPYGSNEDIPVTREATHRLPTNVDKFKTHIEILEMLIGKGKLKRKKSSQKVPWDNSKEAETIYLFGLLSDKGFLSENFQDGKFCRRYLDDYILSEQSHKPRSLKERWLGTPGQIIYLFELLLKKEFLPEAFKHKKHVNTAKCFLKKNGNEFGNIDLARTKDKYEGNLRLQKKPQQAGIIEEIVEKLTEYQTSQI